MNEEYCSITTGSENFKYKLKNVHEDSLFKNEDEMYQIDHHILQLQNVVTNLRKEEEFAVQWEKNKKLAQ